MAVCCVGKCREVQRVCKFIGREGCVHSRPVHYATAFSSSWRINWRTQSIRVLRSPRSCINFSRVGPSRRKCCGCFCSKPISQTGLTWFFSANSIVPPFSLPSSFLIPSFCACWRNRAISSSVRAGSGSRPKRSISSTLISSSSFSPFALAIRL